MNRTMKSITWLAAMPWLANLLTRHGALALGAVCLLFTMLPSGAQAAVSCTVQPAGAVSLEATVQNGTSIAPREGLVSLTPMVLSCTGDANENFQNMQICANYGGLPSQGSYAFTLIREDGRTLNTLNNRIVLYPLTAGYNHVETAGTWNSVGGGTIQSGGVGAGVTQFNLVFSLVPPAGAIVESGTYTGNLAYSVKLIKLSGLPANDNCNQAYDYDIEVDTVSTPITVNVPAQCTMTTPGMLDFGQHESLNSGVDNVSSNFSVTCNNNADKFHVYTDSGQHHLVAGQYRMKRNGTEDYVPYQLFDAGDMPIPTEPDGNASVAGKYTQSTSGANVQIRGQIPPQTGTVRPGVYTDTVVINVQY